MRLEGKTIAEIAEELAKSRSSEDLSAEGLEEAYESAESPPPKGQVDGTFPGRTAKTDC